MLELQPNNEEGHTPAASTKLEAAHEAADAAARSTATSATRASSPRSLFLGQRIPLAGVAHQNGTIRFGHDPKTSALDVNCRAHEVDNLYVVDGSFFPSSGAVNPALTIMANALRVGDHLLGAARGDARRAPRGARHEPGRGSRSWPARPRCRWRRPGRGRAGTAPPACVRAVDAVGMTVADMDRSVDFYTDVLGFEKVSDVEVAGERVRAPAGRLRRCGMRVVRLRLGDEQIELTEYLAPRGRPIPADSRSNDRWFQHVAIIVSDMDRAYARLRRAPGRARLDRRRSACRTGTRTPAGIQAFYFKDPDGHPLEILAVPAGQGRPEVAPAERPALPRHRPHRDRRRRHRREPRASTATRSGSGSPARARTTAPSRST